MTGYDGEHEGAEWVDEAAGPVVRPYALTGGRTGAAGERLDLAAQVVATRARTNLAGLQPEHLRILELCQRPWSIAELAVYVDVPLAVAKVLVGDLVERGDVTVRPPVQPAHAPDRHLLQAVLDGIRAL
ncbi:DUF742 domain-containing protein [Gandjariella thermophila]|uniref:DUF742 domain-containing protein n=1 Tax=Gandjariella thermophila TaxID=1931992 RepID=A0A4D4JAT4_9PSEU|nr:DUF742 domain-containing protein [Gandjariella thermophila]GDY31546.1 hypothetical protein GTS_31790 [Gandjariella thermophila]